MAEFKKYISREDESIFLCCDIGLNPYLDDDLSFDDAVALLLNKQVPLEINESLGTEVLDSSYIDEINKVLPNIDKIIKNPRSFVRSKEEKVPIEVAKSIPFKSISQLSRDSSDWYSRTYLSVQPKNVLAYTKEETINLYENRFIVTLIKRIDKEINKAYKSVKERLENYLAEKGNEVIEDLYNKQTPSIYRDKFYVEGDYVSGFQEKLEQEEQTLKRMISHVNRIKGTKFFKSLSKYPPIKDPIMKTNILVFEKRYHSALNLWYLLNDNIQEEVVEIPEEYDDSNIDNYFNIYVFLNILLACKEFGLEEISHNKFDCHDKLNLPEPLNFVLKDNTHLFLSFDKNKFFFKYHYDNKDKNKYDEFFIETSYEDVEKFSNTALSEFSETILNDIDGFIKSKKKKKPNLNAGYHLMSINFLHCQFYNEFSNKVIKRFYGIGNNYDETESKDNLNKWSNYRAAINSLSLQHLDQNLIKICKILNYQVMKHRTITNDLDVCPLCGHKSLKRNTGSDCDYICTHCLHTISLTKCNSCNSDNLLWIKYIDDSFLQDEKIQYMFLDDTKPLFIKLNSIEKLMGYRTTTSFDVVLENNNFKLKTICPHCGVILGNK